MRAPEPMLACKLIVAPMPTRAAGPLELHRPASPPGRYWRNRQYGSRGNDGAGVDDRPVSSLPRCLRKHAEKPAHRLPGWRWARSTRWDAPPPGRRNRPEQFWKTSMRTLMLPIAHCVDRQAHSFSGQPCQDVAAPQRRQAHNAGAGLQSVVHEAHDAVAVQGREQVDQRFAVSAPTVYQDGSWVEGAARRGVSRLVSLLYQRAQTLSVTSGPTGTCPGPGPFPSPGPAPAG